MMEDNGMQEEPSSDYAISGARALSGILVSVVIFIIALIFAIMLFLAGYAIEWVVGVAAIMGIQVHRIILLWVIVRKCVRDEVERLAKVKSLNL